MKSFIKQGENYAQVEVRLANKGSDGYRPEIYGEEICIQRRISIEGSSSYKIKSQSGTNVGTKREDLDAICEHMGLQVNNPLSILTQDNARQFLSSSSAAEKYKVRILYIECLS